MSSLSEIRDPLHGYVRVNELEAGIVDTPTFQRLKRIKQLSMVHLVYPGAEHSRFTHSLGVMHLAGKTAKVLRRQDLVTEDEAQEVRLAALLHDVGHGPFSHTFEDLLWSVRGMTHEDVTTWLIEEGELTEVIEDGGYEPSRIAAMALGRYRGEKSFMGEIIAGPYCSDILDYLIRDAYFCGVEYGRIDTFRIIDSLSVCDGRLAVSVGSLYALEAFVIARYEMFKAVYFHRTARAAGLMISEAMQLADEELGFTSFKNPEDYLQLTDEYVVDRILGSKSRRKNMRRAKELVRAILARDLIKMTFERVFQTKDPFFTTFLKEEATRESLLSRIAEKAEVPRDKLFFDYPSLVSVPHYSMKGEYPAFVRENGEKRLISVPTLSHLLDSLAGYTNIIRIYSTEDVREKVEGAVGEILGGVDYTYKISY